MGAARWRRDEGQGTRTGSEVDQRARVVQADSPQVFEVAGSANIVADHAFEFGIETLRSGMVKFIETPSCEWHCLPSSDQTS